jgi:ubiquinone/menaquinone biosynthesis C-methylase UbiE
VNVDFNHDVNYEGFFHLEEALLEGRPAGLKHFGDWPTLYEGLSSLPEQVKKSWFGFDHFYSDHSFDEALEIVFRYRPKRLMDVGGNTGRWALRCVDYDREVRVTIVDLPQQLAMMREQTAGKPGADRIDGYAMDMLDPASRFPEDLHPDLIWMSQFLDCFSEEEILGILERAAAVMGPESRLAIMETFWDRQKYEPASFCLTMTSLYFTVMANGNSKMYHSDDMTRLVERAGLGVEEIHDGLGQGHSIMICKRK